MPKRTQVVCLHEGKKDSVDLIFANAFIKAYDPEWLRPYSTGVVYFRPCGGKSSLLKVFPEELKNCITRGSNTTLVVLTDLDDECTDGEELKKQYWEAAKEQGIAREKFDGVLFITPKYRIENWIEYLSTGTTDENEKGPRLKYTGVDARKMAKDLVDMCRNPKKCPDTFPPSLEWSCQNWHSLVKRMG
jgi:hypothetical protein